MASPFFRRADRSALVRCKWEKRRGKISIDLTGVNKSRPEDIEENVCCFRMLRAKNVFFFAENFFFFFLLFLRNNLSREKSIAVIYNEGKSCSPFVIFLIRIIFPLLYSG